MHATFLLFLSLFSNVFCNSHKISVLIFGARSFEDTVHTVKNAYSEVFGSEEYHIGNTTIEPEFVNSQELKNGNETNQLELTSDLICKRMMNGSLTAVIYSASVKNDHEDYLSLVSTTAYSMGLYLVPTVGVMVREAEFGKKLVYPTFVRPTPSYADEAILVLHLLRRLKYRQVVLLFVKGDKNGIGFIEQFRDLRKHFKIHVQSYIELTMSSTLNDTLAEKFEEVTSNIIVLFATKSSAYSIFSAASSLSPPLTGRGKVWIVNEEAARAHNVHDGVIAARLNQSPLSALRDSFQSIKNGLDHLAEVGDLPFLSPPTTCKKEANEKEPDLWTTQHAQLLYKLICSTSFPKISYIPTCERTNVEYDVINFSGGRREVGSLSAGNLLLQEEKIYWPGGSLKPLEITLPKHLRVVTINDPPFVYTHRVFESSLCATLGILRIELSLDDYIMVPGPWYSCPKYQNDRIDFFCCAGYAIDLLSNISVSEIDDTNGIDTSFTFSLHLNESYGSVHLPTEGGYILTGALGELHGDMADMAIGGMTINPERERYIDFSEPWLYHGIKIMEKMIPRDSPMESFLQPMKSSLWSTLLLSVILIGCVIYILDLKSPFDRFYNIDRSIIPADDPFLERTADDRVDFGESMWFVWGVLLNSGVSEKTPRSCSARVMGIVWCGFCMIMVASYTANLAAFLVLDQPEKGLTGITDPRLRNPSANFSFATVRNSNVYQYFKRHVELSTMFRKMETHNVEYVHNAVQELLNGTLDAFIWDSSRLEFEASRRCDLRTRGSLFGRSAYGVGLQKNSPWTPHITAAILRMTESGQMEHLDSKWISIPSQCVVETHKSPARLGLTNMKDVFILVTGGVLAGAIFSFIEVSHGRKKARKSRHLEVARRYFLKWRRYTRMPVRNRAYKLNRPVLRKGFAGVEATTLEVCRKRLLSRTMKVPPADIVLDTPFVPNINFGRQPVLLFCSSLRWSLECSASLLFLLTERLCCTSCFEKQLVETEVRSEAGLFAVFTCLLLSLMLLWPCAALPCFLGSCADFTHFCPFCAHTIGKYRRGRSKKFYV